MAPSNGQTQRHLSNINYSGASEKTVHRLFGSFKSAIMSAKRKADTAVPAEETDQLLIRPL